MHSRLTHICYHRYVHFPEGKSNRASRTAVFGEVLCICGLQAVSGDVLLASHFVQ